MSFPDLLSHLPRFLALPAVPRSPISFIHPWYLLLLAALPLFYWVAVRQAGRGSGIITRLPGTGSSASDRRTPRGPWPLVLWLRLVIAGLVVLALAGLRVPAPPKSVATVFVVDLSTSVPADIHEAAKNWVREALAKEGPDDLAAIVTFGRYPVVEMPLGKDRDHATWGPAPAPDATNLADALRLAGDLLPAPSPAGGSPGALRRIVVLSDGNETTGDAQRGLLRPGLRDVEVAVLALPQRLQDTAITAFAAPPTLREGEPVDLRVAMLAPSDENGTLRIFAQGAGDGVPRQTVYEQPVQLQAGANEQAASITALPQGAWTLQAELTVDNDSQPENNTSWAYTLVGEPARVLLVEGTPGAATAVQQALADSRVGVDTLRPGQLPATAQQMDRLLQYQSVILANVPASAMSKEQMTLLQQYVSARGRGLVVIGGDQTFGLGDYADTPLEAALPVTVQPPDKDQTPSLALLLVIDRSGSMSNTETGDRRQSRMELAKEGAIQAVEALKDGDQVGVVAFDNVAAWISDFRTVQNAGDRRAITDRIATIQPEGGTDIFSAMEYAYRGMQQVQARVKHVILLTDGDDPAPRAFPQLLTTMRRAGITVSSLGVSSEAGQSLLQDIARRGGGRYNFTNSPSDIPRIMTQEARLAGQSFKVERDFKPRLAAAAPAVRGLVPADFPQLHGYVRVSAKPGSETVLTSDQEEVILSEWQYGLGRALVWTPDAQGDWAKDWVDTDAYRSLWPQAVRWTMPAPGDPGLLVSVQGDGQMALVRVESLESTGEFRNLLQTTVDVVPPSGPGRKVPLSQVAPGRYEGRFALLDPGVYFLNVTQSDDTGAVVASKLSGYALPQLPEYQLTPANRVLLERLAADTGGPRLNKPQEAWRTDTVHAWQPQEIWRELLMAALVLFVADVALRRMRPTRQDVRALGAATSRRLRGLRPRPISLPRVHLHPLQAGRRRP